MALILNIFVRSHRLRKEREGVVLGVDREKVDLSQTENRPNSEAIRLAEINDHPPQV